MDFLIGLMQSQGIEQYHIPARATSETTPTQPTHIVTQVLSSPRNPTTPTYTGRYQIGDIANKKKLH